MDRLDALMARWGFTTETFYNGEFCGFNTLGEQEQVGFLHLVRAGKVMLHNEDGPPVLIDQPSLVLYAHPGIHRLAVPHGASVHLLCARVRFHGNEKNALARALPGYLQVPLADLPPLGKTLELLFDEAVCSEFGQQLILDRLCDVLVVQLIRHAFRTQQISEARLSGLSDPALSKALMAIHRDPAYPWTVDELAAESGMSRSRFARQFHLVVGSTPADYLTEQRMVLAQRLLLKHKPVQNVAFEVGYGSQPAFTKAFTAKFGMSPRAWLGGQRVA